MKTKQYVFAMVLGMIVGVVLGEAIGFMVFGVDAIGYTYRFLKG
jgi:hypothetical protein